MHWADKNVAGFLRRSNPASVKTPDGIYCYLFPANDADDSYLEVIGEWHKTPEGEDNFLIRSWKNGVIRRNN